MRMVEDPQMVMLLSFHRLLPPLACITITTTITTTITITITITKTHSVTSGDSQANYEHDRGEEHSLLLRHHRGHH
jgi:hypothetical protein